LARENQEIRSAVLGATVTSVAMVAYQVAAKATRDAFFLSNFPVQALPVMMIATSILAIGVAYVFTRALNRWGPERVIPTGFAGSAALLLVEWAISFPFRRPAAILVYLHHGCFGALLVSGFWSFLNERFDPRTARRVSGQVTGAGAVGGVVGGVVGSLFGRGLPVTAMIPVLAVFHLVCAGAVLRLRPNRASAGPASGAPSGTAGGLPSPVKAPRSSGSDIPGRSHFRLLRESSYLRGLMALVLFVTLSEGWVDLVLRGGASLTLGHGGGLLRFFAAFYTGVSVLTVLAQVTFGRIALEKLGPARTTAILPSATAVAAATASVIPVLGTAAVARGVQSVLSNSLYRSGYEVLFTPVPAREKRAVKAMADVGASRVGDLLAAAVAQVVVLVAMSSAGRILEGLAAVTAVAAAWTAFRLHRGYSESLARGLVSRAIQLDLSEVRDATTRSALLRTMGPLALSQVQRLPDREDWGTAPSSPDAGADHAKPDVVEDPVVARGRDLRSRDPRRVIRALEAGPLPSPLIDEVVPLLAWDDVARAAITSLRRSRPVGIEALTARLLDSEEDFTIRRRIPLVLGTYEDRAAVEGLVGALADPRFEVRYRSGRALAHLTAVNPSLSVARDMVFQAVLREVQSGAGVWETRTLLDRLDDEGWSPVVDELVRNRADRSLEHVFTLLALVFPRQPLQIAFRGLHTDDPLLHGTALEYLESILPPEIRKPLWPFLEDKRPKRTGTTRSPEEALRALIESSESIAIRLDELRRSPPR